MSKLTIEQEQQLWCDLYMAYDDNELHCENAYFNNNVDSLSKEELHESNIEHIKWFMSLHVTADELVKLCPLAETLMAEITQ